MKKIFLISVFVALSVGLALCPSSGQASSLEGKTDWKIAWKTGWKVSYKGLSWERAKRGGLKLGEGIVWFSSGFFALIGGGSFSEGRELGNTAHVLVCSPGLYLWGLGFYRWVQGHGLILGFDSNKKETMKGECKKCHQRVSEAENRDFEST